MKWGGEWPGAMKAGGAPSVAPLCIYADVAVWSTNNTMLHNRTKQYESSRSFIHIAKIAKEL